MMSRRLLPFFIERGLGLKTELKNSKFLDLLSLFLFLGFMIAEIFFQTIISHTLAGLLFIIHSIKLFNWYHKGIWKKSLLWSIYLAYVFLTLGFGLYVASYFINMMPNISTHSFAFGIALMTAKHDGQGVFRTYRA